MDTAQWPDQEIVLKPMEEIVVTKTSNTCSSITAAEAVGHNHDHGHGGAPADSSYNKNQPSTMITEKKKAAARPQIKDVNCPRCNSTNTKFCYYNNYSSTQPRYFCKTCKRYWTEGGTLRNIPVGGVSRKNNKRSSSSASAAAHAHAHGSKLNLTASNKMMSKLPDLVVTTGGHANFPNHPLYYSLYQNPKDFLHYHEGQDLNLGFFSRSAPNFDEYRGLSEFMHLPSTHTETGTPHNSATSDVPPDPHNPNPNHNIHHQHQHQLSALELITGLASSRGGGLASFMPMSIGDPAVYSSSEAAGGFPSQRTDDHFKPTVNFSVEGLGGGGGYGGGNLQDGSMGGGGGNEQNHRRLLFPFEDLKQPPPQHRATTTTNNQSLEQEDNKEREATAGYWSGLLGGGGGAAAAGGGTGSW